MFENTLSNDTADCGVIIEISLEDAISNMTGVTGSSKLGSILCDVIDDHVENNILAFGGEIFGRDEELAMLWDAYDRVSAGPSEVILISGESGIGKTAIVETFRGPVTTTDGYFTSGKWDQLRRPEPFSGLVTAFEDMCDLILQSDERDEIRESVKASLGDEAHILATLISNLSHLTGNSGYPSLGHHVGFGQAIQRFPDLCCTFLRAVATPDHPILIFLDDIQWADAESLHVIMALITDNDSKHVLFVCTHRLPEDCDDEFNAFVKNINKQLKQERIQTESLIIKSLDHQGINAWFSILFHSRDVEATKLFSELTWKKTNGNPFFVQKFLEHLHIKGIISYDIDHWTWDLTRAENETECSANVVGLVLERIATLSADTQLVLKLGAILGFSFEIDVLKEVGFAELARSEETVTASKVLLNDRFNTALATSLKTGLIEKGTGFAFKFTHNNVQHSLIQMKGVADSDGSLHLRIGRRLLAWRKSIADDRKESIFLLAVDQLNRAAPLMKLNEAEITELVLLNLEAAQMVAAKCAIESAAAHVQLALRVLDRDQMWRTHYDLSLRVCNACADYAFLTGNQRTCSSMVDEILNNAANILDMQNAYKILMASLGAEGGPRKGLNLGLQALKKLGEPFPKHANYLHITLAAIKINILLMGKTDEYFLSLPRMTTNPSKVAAMDLIFSCSALLQYLCENELRVLFCLRMLSLTLKYGISENSSYAFAYWAMIQSIIGKRSESLRFGQLSLRIAEVYFPHKANVSTKCIVHSYSLHWKKPRIDAIASLRSAYLDGERDGEFLYAFKAGIAAATNCFFSGSPLSESEELISEVCERIARAGNDPTLLIGLVLWQCIYNFLGYPHSTDPLMLSGDAVEDQSAVLKEATETKNYAAIHVIHTCLLRLACFFGNWEMALQHVMAVENNIRMLQCVPGSYMYTEYLFFSGLTHIIQAQRATHFGRKGYGKHLRKAKRILKTLDKYVGEGTLDCLPYCLLLDTEVMYFDFMIRKRNLPNVMCAFDKAIAVCKEIDASHIHALASERLGLVLHNLGEEKRAITCFLEAQKMYHKWQAYAKIEPLDEMIANAISGTVVTMQTM